MIADTIEIHESGGRAELRCLVHSRTLERPFTLRYLFPESLRPCMSTRNGNPFLAALLPLAMRTGETLRIEAEVSPQLLDAAGEIQAIYRCWDRSLSKVAIEAPCRRALSPATQQGRRTGLHFSLGVDSFHALLENRRRHPSGPEAITDLIYVDGFELAFASRPPAVHARVQSDLRRVGDAMGKEVVLAESNARALSDGLVKWNVIYFGAFLAAVGLAVEDAFGRIHIASGPSYGDLGPMGSHPLLDPLWSTEHLRFVHYGCDTTKLQKVAMIADEQVVMDTLRVCFQKDVEGYNCGRCEKCLRVMVCLQAAGALGRCRTLPGRLDLDALRRIRLKTYRGQSRNEELIADLGDSEANREVREIFRELVKQGRVILAQRTEAAREKAGFAGTTPASEAR